MDFDIDRFIFEIERHPAIWNIKCEAYSDRFQKVRQWEEVVNIFARPRISIDEKKKIGALLQKRWRNIRDAFVKEKRQMESGSVTNRKRYRYFEQLLFLLPVISTNKTENSSQSEDHNDSVSRSSEERNVSVSRTSGGNALKKKKSIPTPTVKIGSEVKNFLNSTRQQKIRDEDPDLLFLVSLVNDFKRVPMRLKSMVKINILKCIMEAQDELYNFVDVAATSAP